MDLDPTTMVVKIAIHPIRLYESTIYFSFYDLRSPEKLRFWWFASDRQYKSQIA